MSDTIPHTTEMVVAINSGLSHLVKDKVIVAMGVSPNDATVSLDVAGNVVSVSAQILLANAHSITRALQGIEGVGEIRTPNITSQLVTVSKDAVNEINLFAKLLNLDMNQFLTNLRNWILSSDTMVQFADGVEGLNGSTPNTYTGTAGVPVPICIHVTDGNNVRDLMNSVSYVTVLITGGTAVGKTVNDKTDSALLPIINGGVKIFVNATGAGTVELALSNPHHPSIVLDVTDTATVTLS